MSEEKKPYQLPEGWTTVKVGDLAYFINGKTFNTKEWKRKGVPIIRIQKV
jgi:type I restriction enzyme S subunit